MKTKETKLRKGQKYAELLCDFMFKRLFGSEANKDVLIWFLNMILEDADIKDVTFISTEHYGLTKEDRKAVFDISCTCSDGSTLVVEMQKGYQEYFRERAVFYTSYPIAEQGRIAKEKYISEHASKGDGEEFRWDFNLKPVTVVAILNFMFQHDESWPEGRYHSSYRLREDCTHEIMTDTLRYVFLELGRFRKRIWELETQYDKWMYLLRHMHEMVEIPDIFQAPEFQRLFILAKIGNFTPDELKEYENSLKNMSDYYNIIDSAEKIALKKGLEIGHEQGLAEGLEQGREQGREEGREEGLEQGREEGREEGLLLAARNMLSQGMPVDIVMNVTGLSEDVIDKLS